MDLFQHPYYSLNKRMLMFIGQWPDQSTRTRCILRTAHIYFYVSEIMSRIRTIYNKYDDSDIYMDWLTQTVINITGSIYFISFMLTYQQTLMLLNRIRTDWQMWAREREVNILHEYTDLGKRINIAFAVTIYSCFMLVGIPPIAEKIIDIILKNGTEPGKFLFLVDYYRVDEQKYYLYVVLYFNVVVIMTSASILTSLVMLISHTQHGSGVFAALRHRLQCLGNNDTSAETEKASYALNDSDMVQLAWCIDRHNDIIEYVNFVDESFNWTMFFAIGLGMMLANGLGLLILTQPNDIQAILSALSLIGFMALYLLIYCAASQILIDHSISIRAYIYNSQWYRLSPKAQKLLQCMMIRCNVPCQLTAGNIFIMSIRTVWIMLKTYLSFFAFVRSTQ